MYNRQKSFNLFSCFRPYFRAFRVLKLKVPDSRYTKSTYTQKKYELIQPTVHLTRTRSSAFSIATSVFPAICAAAIEYDLDFSTRASPSTSTSTHTV